MGISKKDIIKQLNGLHNRIIRHDLLLVDILPLWYLVYRYRLLYALVFSLLYGLDCYASLISRGASGQWSRSLMALGYNDTWALGAYSRKGLANFLLQWPYDIKITCIK
jgi:hypothetical protein